MAAFSTLTPDQQATILAFAPQFRSAVIALTKALNNIALLDQAWNSNVKAINALLDTTAVIPDNTGLAGAQSFTQADLLSAMNALETMLTTNNSNAWRAAYVKFAGIANTMLTG
jgi:hypothetical protein